MRTASISRARRVLALVAAALALAAGASACGGGSSKNGSASTTTSTSTSDPAPSTTSASTYSPRTAALWALVKCVRAHGASIPDPRPGPNGRLPGNGMQTILTVEGEPGGEQALQACSSEISALESTVGY